MTAEAFAALVEARRTGPEMWQARCPAHPDRSPSLSIRAGSDGRVLVNCFAGCSHLAIVAALGLSVRDLFVGAVPLAPAEQAAFRMLRQERERKAREERAARIAAFDRALRWDAAASALGAKLARTPEDKELARVFHLACERLHYAEVEAEQWARRICPRGKAQK